jgi:hypothetical protein
LSQVPAPVTMVFFPQVRHTDPAIYPTGRNEVSTKW